MRDPFAAHKPGRARLRQFVDFLRRCLFPQAIECASILEDLREAVADARKGLIPLGFPQNSSKGFMMDLPPAPNRLLRLGSSNASQIQPARQGVSPTVKFLSPRDRVVVGGIVTATISANGSKLSKMAYYIDTELQASVMLFGIHSFMWYCLWITPDWRDGVHTLTAKAYDSWGNVATSSIVVTVHNQVRPPDALVWGRA